MDFWSPREIVQTVLVFVAVYAVTYAVQAVFGITFQRACVSVAAVVWIGGSVYMLWKREIPIGIDGRPPSHIARGTSAVVIALRLLGVGIVMLLRADALAKAMP